MSLTTIIKRNSMTYETLLFERDADGIGLVTLNRPKRANAMSQHMLRELDDLCAQMRADRDLRVVVVTGAGMAFSSGFDLKDQADAMPKGVAEWVPLLEADFKGIMSFWELPHPTIAAVNGPALAGGFELMLACDLHCGVRLNRTGGARPRHAATNDPAPREQLSDATLT
jgi:enoyl-CoA hydratase